MIKPTVIVRRRPKDGDTMAIHSSKGEDILYEDSSGDVVFRFLRKLKRERKIILVDKRKEKRRNWKIKWAP